MQPRALLVVAACSVFLAGCTGAPPSGDATPTVSRTATSTAPSVSSATPTESTVPSATPTESTVTVDPPGTPVSELPDGPRSYPSPPEQLTDAAAEEVAAATEEAYVHNRLAYSGVDGYSVGTSTVPFESRVVDHRYGGAIVYVQMPYYYQSGSLHVDDGSEARYFVGEETITRIDGSEIDPNTWTPEPTETPESTTDG